MSGGIFHALARLESGLIAACGASALLLACYTVIARYVAPQMTVDWALDIIVMVVVWGVMLAGGRTARHQAHIKVDLFLDLASPRLRLAMSVLAAAVFVATAVLLLWSGILVVEEAIRWDERSSSTWRIPLWIYYLSLPVGMTSMALQAVIGLATGRRGGHDHLWTEGGK
ncbi:MAG: TRAP transporter small permease [Azospirillaceae bacterium]